MDVDEARHHEVRRQIDAPGPRMTGAQRARLVDLVEAPASEQGGHSGTRTLIEQQAAGSDDQVLRGPKRALQVGHQACSSISPGAGALN